MVTTMGVQTNSLLDGTTIGRIFLVNRVLDSSIRESLRPRAWCTGHLPDAAGRIAHPNGRVFVRLVCGGSRQARPGQLYPQASARTRSQDTEAPTATSPRQRSTRTLSPRWNFGFFETRRRIRTRAVSSTARRASKGITLPSCPVRPRGRDLRRAGAETP
jgi:hypothetical protein